MMDAIKQQPNTMNGQNPKASKNENKPYLMLSRIAIRTPRHTINRTFIPTPYTNPRP